MFPRIRVEVVAGAGHWVHADRPEAFLACIRRALRESSTTLRADRVH
jgi:esterase